MIDVNAYRKVFELTAKTCGIYALVNVGNGKVYIGQSVHVRRRVRDHFSNLRAGRYGKINPRLQAAFNKHSEAVFVAVLLVECIQGDLNDAEKKWIDLACSVEKEHGYNLKGWTDRMLVRYSEESRQRMRAAKLGRPMPQATREKIRTANAGRRLANYAASGMAMPDETRAKVSAGRKGKGTGPHSPERRQAVSAALTGKKLSERHRKQCRESHIKADYRFNKRILQMAIDGTLIREFFSMQEAKRATGAHNISRCANGLQDTAGGFRWAFVRSQS